MGHFDRPEKRRQPRTVHPRLRRLDYELMLTRTKRFDYLFAVGQGARIRVCVMRDIDDRVYATAEVAGRVLKVDGGHSPSFAFTLISITIHRMLCRMTEAERIAIRLENPPLQINEAPDGLDQKASMQSPNHARKGELQ